MAKVKIAVIVGSNRRESINAKLAHALASLGADRAEFEFVPIGDLPLYNQDLEAELPQSVVRFKSQIVAADGLLFVTPEHNRSIPALLKNAIDWGARPYGQNSWSKFMIIRIYRFRLFRTRNLIFSDGAAHEGCCSKKHCGKSLKAG